MERDNPPPYNAYGAPPPPGMNPNPYQPPYPPPHQPPLQPMKPHFEMPPTHEQTHHVVVTQTPIIVRPLGPEPQQIVCPSCRASICTAVTTEANSKTHLFALLLCLVGCWPCCCIPYCMDSCQSANHYCPNCQAFLGSYSS